MTKNQFQAFLAKSYYIRQIVFAVQEFEVDQFDQDIDELSGDLIETSQSENDDDLHYNVYNSDNKEVASDLNRDELDAFIIETLAN